MKSKTVTFKGQKFTLHAISGLVAHDYHSRIVGHLTTGLAKLTGLELSALLKLGKMDFSGVAGLDVGQLASAVAALCSRLPHDELRFLRDLMLTTATVDLGHPKGVTAVLKALEDGDVIGGPIAIDYLLMEAIGLSILPFTDLVGSAPPTAPTVVPSMESSTSETAG